jgi:hypothetical protein
MLNSIRSDGLTSALTSLPGEVTSTFVIIDLREITIKQSISRHPVTDKGFLESISPFAAFTGHLGFKD